MSDLTSSQRRFIQRVNDDLAGHAEPALTASEVVRVLQIHVWNRETNHAAWEIRTNRAQLQPH